MARKSNKEDRPVSYYSQKVVVTCCKYGLVLPVLGVMWTIDKFILEEPTLLRSGCGTMRRRRAQAKYFTEREAENVPRPLHRKLKKLKGAEPEWRLDEKALEKRRRLSVTTADAQPSKSSGLAEGTKAIFRQRRNRPSNASCALLQLPAEIRNLIWAHVVGNRVIHMFSGVMVDDQPFIFPLTASIFPIRVRWVKRSDKPVRRLSCIQCVPETEAIGQFERFFYLECCSACHVMCNEFGEYMGDVTRVVDTELPGSGLGGEVLDAATEWKPLAVLQTCRQIYTEAIPILYSTNTFDFKSLAQLSQFSTTILPSRLAQVASVRFRIVGPYLERLDAQFGALFTNFPRLRHLEVDARWVSDILIVNNIIPSMRAIAEHMSSQSPGRRCRTLLKVQPFQTQPATGNEDGHADEIDGLEIVQMSQQEMQEDLSSWRMYVRSTPRFPHTYEPMSCF